MPPSSIHAGSPSPSPNRDPPTPGSDNPGDQVDAGVWKRRYNVLRESVNTPSQTASKRKASKRNAE
jgi:hypothetical protein